MHEIQNNYGSNKNSNIESVYEGKKKGEVTQIITKFIIIWMSPCLHSPFKCNFLKLFSSSHHYWKMIF
jgi:hypothetical protein